MASAAVQWAMLRPPVPSDSLLYFGWAESLGNNDISHQTTRLGVLLPVRAALNLFNKSEGAYYAVPFVMTLILVGATYALAIKMSGNQMIAILAAALMSGSTLVLELSSQIFPDTFGAAWFALGLALLLSARGSPRRYFWLVSGAGALGAAYLCRSYVVFLAPVILLIGWIDEWPARAWGTIGLVLLVTFGSELASMAILFGDPFARVRALLGFAERGTAGESLLLAAYGRDATRWTVLRRGPGAFAAYDVGKLLLLSVPSGAVCAIIDRHRRGLWTVLVVWIAALWIPMILLAGLLDPQTPHIRDNHVRYWFLVVPALYILLAATMVLVVGGLRNRTTKVLLGAMIGLLGIGAVGSDIHSIPQNTMFRAFGATQWDEVREFLRSDGAGLDRIYVDRRMAMVLPLYTREVFGAPIWDGEILQFESGGEFLPASDLNGALVLHELGLRYLRNRGLRVPEDYYHPGADWKTVVQRADGSLTVLAQSDLRQVVAEYLDLIDSFEVARIPWSEVEIRGDAATTEQGQVQSTGSDPQLVLDESVHFDSGDLLVLDLEESAATAAQLFWRPEDGTFREDHSTKLRLEEDSRFLIFALSDVPPGSDLRIDPGEASGVVISSILIVHPDGEPPSD